MPIHRRTLLAGAAAAAVTIGCDNNSAPGTKPVRPSLSSADHPNILLLCIDDLRDWVGYMNAHPGVYTPNIDRLRGKSLSFNRAYCSVPVCSASRGSALWGLSPAATGIFETDDKAYGKLLRSKTLKPLPHWFSSAGYKTISTGKVFHWGMGTKRLWDVYEPYPEIPVSYGNHGTLFDYGVLPPGQKHADHEAAEFAARQLQQRHEHPWLMAIGLFQPHVPWRLPQWAFDLHPLDKVALPEVRAEDLDDIPDAGRELAAFPSVNLDGKTLSQHELVASSGLWRQHVQAYLAATSHTDAMVGLILDALEKSAYADNTAIVLWSDHGYHLGEKLHWRKMALWEQATRIPLLINAPGRTEADSSFDLPVSLLDLAPTLTDIANLPQPAQFEGQSLLGLTPEDAYRRPAEMYWGDARSTRIGKWRWTRYGDGGQELYDLQNDREEYTNLLGRTQTLKGGLDALRSNTWQSSQTNGPQSPPGSS